MIRMTINTCNFCVIFHSGEQICEFPKFWTPNLHLLQRTSVCIQEMHPFRDYKHTLHRWWALLAPIPPLWSHRRRYIWQEKLHSVTRLSASLLTSWLFPDKYGRPLDSTPLSSRIMANYQEAVCWKHAARNYICLQTLLGFKHVLRKNERNNNNNKRKKTTFSDILVQKNQKLPSKSHVTVGKCLSHD